MRTFLLLLLLACPAAHAVTHDVLVLYTQKAGLRGINLLPKVSAAITTANKAHSNSGTGIQIRVLAYEPSPMQESGNFTVTGPQLTQNAAVRARRDALGADLVLLISEDSGCGGWGSLMWALSGGRATTVEAFAVVTYSCLSGLTVAHELGHAQGLLHNREDSGADGLKPGFHFGYRVCGVFRDVMSYDCPGVKTPQIPRFSDPTATYNGLPLGIAYEAAPYQAADAVRQLRINGPLIAGLRNP